METQTVVNVKVFLAREEDGDAEEEGEAGDDGVGVGDGAADGLRHVGAGGHADQPREGHHEAEVARDPGLQRQFRFLRIHSNRDCMTTVFDHGAMVDFEGQIFEYSTIVDHVFNAQHGGRGGSAQPGRGREGGCSESSGGDHRVNKVRT